ncbi:hypothetical protein [Brevibacillus reuszeri]
MEKSLASQKAELQHELENVEQTSRQAEMRMCRSLFRAENICELEAD